MKERHGFMFPDVDEFMVNELKSDGTYQASHLEMALEHVTDFSVAIDGGAHIGAWSKLLSARFVRVIAAEPSADTFEALTANMAAHDCANVEAKNIALGRTAGLVSMRLDGRGLQMKNTGARYVIPAAKDLRSVPCETIDSWALPSLGFIKLDIEGSEVDALMGAEATITRCKPIVLFEDKGMWNRFGHLRDAPQRFLLKLGYKQVARASCDVIWAATR